MFSNYIQKIFSPNTTNAKDNETKLEVYSSNTLLSKRVSTNQQKQKPQINLEYEHSSSNSQQTAYEPIYSTKRKTGDEYNTASYSTNTFTAIKLTNRIGYSNLNSNFNGNNNETGVGKQYDTNTYSVTNKEKNLNFNSVNSFSPNGNSRIVEQIKLLNGARSNSSSGMRTSKFNKLL
jgi:hypothetical protein